MTRGLRIALADARRRGAREGTEDAARAARKALVRQTGAGDGARVTPAEMDAWRLARMALAVAEMADRFEEESDDVHGE